MLMTLAVLTSSWRAQAREDSAAPEVKTDAVSTLSPLDQKILATAKDGSEIMSNLTYISDVIGSRLTGSAALKRANEWTAEKMKSYGLSNVHLEPWSIPVGWERGPASGRIVEPDDGIHLSFASMAWTPGTKGKVEGEVVIIKATNTKELQAYKGKLKNAIVLQGPPPTVAPASEKIDIFGQGRRGRRGPGEGRGGAQGPTAGGAPLPSPVVAPPGAPSGAPAAPAAKAGGTPAGAPPAATPGGAPGFNRDAMMANFRRMGEFRRELSAFLHKEGALAIMTDSGKPQGLLNMTGSWQGRDRASTEQPLPTLFVAHEHYSLLYRLASRPAPARTRVELDIQNKFIPGPIAVYNTVGDIVGSEKPDEFVVVGGHLDSWDLGQGTTDNGTGSSVVLEAARILSKLGVRPRRTIRFILFTGEEQGLVGSREYVKAHKDDMPRTSMCLVHDLGTGKVTGLGVLMGHENLKPLLEKELAGLKPLGLAEINPGRMGGSDHASFDQAGVPGFWFQQDGAEYRLTHHSQSDTLDKAQEADLVQGAEMMASIAMHVANMPSLLPRKPAQAPTQTR